MMVNDGIKKQLTELSDRFKTATSSPRISQKKYEYKLKKYAYKNAKRCAHFF